MEFEDQVEIVEKKEFETLLMITWQFSGNYILEINCSKDVFCLTIEA